MMSENHNDEQKYLLVEFYGTENHAGSKAKNDIVSILSKNGYRPIDPYAFSRNFIHLDRSGELRFPFSISKIRGLFYNCLSYLAIKKMYKTLPNNVTLFIQYPLCHLLGRKNWLVPFFSDFLHKKQITLQVLIHDLEGLRNQNKGLQVADLNFLSLPSLVICHTENMKDWLISNGIEKTMIKVLYFFDYLHSSKTNLTHQKSEGIVFAGNLLKSLFLYNKQLPNDITLNLYGNKPDTIDWGKNIRYFGSYASDELPSKLVGGWGLVWDGDSVDTCSGCLGEYLKYNSSHKNSLYIVSRLPIIIWSKSALSSYIIENNLGIAVDSLQEIPKKIGEVSEIDYLKMLTNVGMYATKLESGQSILSVLP